jgi:hypothetical protein
MRRSTPDNRRTAGLRLESLEDRCVPAGSTASIARAYGQLPLSFEVNRGQADTAVGFLSRGDGYGLYLTPTAAVLDLGQGPAAAGQPADDQVLTVQLVGSNPAARPVGLDLQAGVSNYLIGDDPSQWITNVAHYGRAEFQNVYPGVNLVYYGNDQQHLEYDFVLAPGADPGAIRLSFQGTQGIMLNRQGDLVLHTTGGDVVEHAPVVYQTVIGGRQAVPSRYVLAAGNQVAFQVGAFDATRPLVIDPTYSLSYSTFVGGNGGSDGRAIAVDAAGDAYIAGNASNGFPKQNGFQQKYGGGVQDGFVTKLNPTGTGLIYSTYIGGHSDDAATGVAVDSSGNVYVTGDTASTDLPTKSAFQPSNHGGYHGWDYFLSKLSASGSALLYSTYLGGSTDELSDPAVAVDNSGDAFVGADTASTDFPTTPHAYQTTFAGSDDGTVTKVNTNLSGAGSLVYSTYLGTLGISSIAVDGNGNAYVPSENVNLTPGACVTKLDPTGSLVLYSTPVTPTIHAIAVDASGEVYGTAGGAVVTKLDASGSQVYSFNFGGGSGGTGGEAIAVDGAGHAFVTGVTASSAFPTVNATQSTYGGGSYDAFVTEIADPSQAGGAPTVVFSSYLGGDATDVGNGIAADGAGNIYVTGYTYSRNFPTTSGAFQTQLPGAQRSAVISAFVTKIAVQNTPAAAPGSNPAGGADPVIPLTPAATSPTALPAGTAPTDLVGVLPFPSRPATPETASVGRISTDSRTAPMLESGSPLNAAMAPIVNADAGSSRRMSMLLALADGGALDEGPNDWLLAPVTLIGEAN